MKFDSDNEIESTNESVEFTGFVIIDDGNIRYPYECSNDDLKILEFQDRIIKCQEILDKYQPYTAILSYGYSRFKMISSVAKGILL
jgi:hypothetical protein